MAKDEATATATATDKPTLELSTSELKAVFYELKQRSKKMMATKGDDEVSQAKRAYGIELYNSIKQMNMFRHVQRFDFAAAGFAVAGGIGAMFLGPGAAAAAGGLSNFFWMTASDDAVALKDKLANLKKERPYQDQETKKSGLRSIDTAFNVLSGVTGAIGIGLTFAAGAALTIGAPIALGVSSLSWLAVSTINIAKNSSMIFSFGKEAKQKRDEAGFSRLGALSAWGAAAMALGVVVASVPSFGAPIAVLGALAIASGIGWAYSAWKNRKAAMKVESQFMNENCKTVVIDDQEHEVKVKSGFRAVFSNLFNRKSKIDKPHLDASKAIEKVADVTVESKPPLVAIADAVEVSLRDSLQREGVVLSQEMVDMAGTMSTAEMKSTKAAGSEMFPPPPAAELEIEQDPEELTVAGVTVDAVDAVTSARTLEAEVDTQQAQFGADHHAESQVDLEEGPSTRRPSSSA